jgi:hypothetical protein
MNGDNMAFATKLEILKRNGYEIFEKGENGIKSIEIVYTNDRIIIEFNDSSEWDYKIISFNSVDSFKFSEEKQQGDKIFS